MTSALYRVTESFPGNEPLRFGLRDWGLKVMTGLLPYHFSNDSNMPLETAEENLLKIQTLRALMEVARGQNWVNEVNLLLLDQEYSRVEEQLSQLMARGKNPSPVEEAAAMKSIEVSSREQPEIQPMPEMPVSEPKRVGPIPMKPDTTYNLDAPAEQAEESSAPTERQDKILQMIRQQPRIQMRQIQERLTDVTSRTLRRDLESLVQQGKIRRIGRGTGTFYQVNFVDNS